MYKLRRSAAGQPRPIHPGFKLAGQFHFDNRGLDQHLAAGAVSNLAQKAPNQRVLATGGAPPAPGFQVQADAHGFVFAACLSLAGLYAGVAELAVFAIAHGDAIFGRSALVG